MRKRATIVAAALASAVSAAVLLAPREAAAQTGIPPVQPLVERDPVWGPMSNITMVVGASLVFLMPRVYYNDPEATVGWKARWHVSQLAPAMSLTALTLLMDGPIRDAVKNTRPGCTPEETLARLDGSGCETWGGPSTQAFGAWSATGAGIGIFLVDTFKYSDGRFHLGSFIGNVAAPLTLSIVTSVGRSIDPGTTSTAPNGFHEYENWGQNLLAGGLPGLLSGAVIGVGYALLQRPNCGYGNNVICW